jgi:cyclopropane fatty-acyl-phospholipid synthase-like methyltransferase
MKNKLETPNDVRDLLFASTASASLGAAIETGLLWLLAEKPLDGDDVARRLGIPVKRCRYWLQLLHQIGILDQTPHGYQPSSLARAAILDVRSPESWQHLALDERERTAGVSNLALYIREPGSVWAAQGMTAPRDYVAKMRSDSARAREFTRMLHEVHQYLANELAEYLDLTGVRRLLDVGGGSGMVSMALLRKYPDLEAVVVDTENVCTAAREIVAENGFAGRIAHCPLDFETEELPDGFDMVMLCDVGIFGETLFRKMWASLNPGGRVVVVFHFPPTENLAPPHRLEWTFLDSLEDPNFSFPTIAETRAQLARAGFRSLPGERTLSDNRIVIQAQK